MKISAPQCWQWAVGVSRKSFSSAGISPSCKPVQVAKRDGQSIISGDGGQTSEQQRQTAKRNCILKRWEIHSLLKHHEHLKESRSFQVTADKSRNSRNRLQKTTTVFKKDENLRLQTQTVLRLICCWSDMKKIQIKAAGNWKSVRDASLTPWQFSSFQLKMASNPRRESPHALCPSLRSFPALPLKRVVLSQAPWQI